jgi:hypothetical protein
MAATRPEVAFVAVAGGFDSRHPDIVLIANSSGMPARRVSAGGFGERRTRGAAEIGDVARVEGRSVRP